MTPLTHVVEAWASLYSNSWALRSGISFAHIGGLVGAGGCAIAADRATILASSRGREDKVGHLETLHAVHRIVVAGLIIVAISGGLLLLADLDAYLHAAVFWIKMAAVVALTVNGARLVAAGRKAIVGSETEWSALRRASIASLVLWFVTTLLGTVLPNVL